ncbi:hypothetical protein Tsubulata_003524 [Turnera subulata]|uniref:Thioredoxin domain-containing protein n=1 Tax=Turnera subulata TaxID=218843 RepID=A0A9Q0JID5_9ROSI|nr:hypothetical protein Tsubulata_003524 [Turnera subulata]
MTRGVSRGRPPRLHDKAELRLPELHREFALLSTSFATNNPDASFLFFWELEFKESQSSFSLFGVNTLPYVRLVGPNVKSLKDSDQMDQGDFSRLAGSMAEFIESRTKLTVGPTSTIPFFIKKLLTSQTFLHDPNNNKSNDDNHRPCRTGLDPTISSIYEGEEEEEVEDGRPVVEVEPQPANIKANPFSREG